MSKLKSCVLCDTRTSGNDDKRFFEYLERLITASINSSDERSLVFIATDQLSKLDELISSARQDSDDDAFDGPSKGRYAHPEDARTKIRMAIRCLSLADESLTKFIDK